MKTLFKILLVVLMVVAYACHKEDVRHGDPTILTGKWQIHDVYFSAGGAPEWHAASNKDVYIQFNANGKVEGNYVTDFVSYTLKDSVTIAFTKKDNTIQEYKYSLKNGYLGMSPSWPVYCFEACGDRFVKVSD